MRKSVDLPAPLGQTSATASPRATEKEIPASAHWVARVKGSSIARQPEIAGGKYFSRPSTMIACSCVTGSYNRIHRDESSSVVANSARCSVECTCGHGKAFGVKGSPTAALLEPAPGRRTHPAQRKEFVKM